MKWALDVLGGGAAMRNCQGKWQLAQPSVCPVETEKTEKIRRVCWLSVLDCGNRQHQPPAPAAPRATMSQGGEEMSGYGCPGTQVLPLLTYKGSP